MALNNLLEHSLRDLKVLYSRMATGSAKVSNSLYEALARKSYHPYCLY